VAISIPGHQSFCRFAKLPPVEPKKVPDIVKFEAVQQIPFPLEEVEWDFQTFVSPDSPDVEVGIFAVTRQRITERLTTLTDLGITPEVATISPVAAYNALAVDLGFTPSTPGTIILDVGTVATDLIIAEAGRVWVRTFPIGGHNFTEAVAQAFKLTYTKAEKLKREAEQTQHARHVFQAMRPVFGELVQEVQRSIGFYQSVHPNANLQRLIGLGSTFRLPGLRKFLKQQIGLDVYRMEQFKKLSLEGERAAEFQDASLNLCTAYGLALQGLGQATLRANLMPVPVVRGALWKRKVPYFATAAGLAACAAGAMFIRPVLDSLSLSNAEGSRPQVLTSAVSRAQQLKTAAEQAGVTSGAAPDLRASRIVDLLDDRELFARILSDVGGAMGAAQPAGAAQTPLHLVTMTARFEPGTPGADAGASADFGGVGSQDWGGGSDPYNDPRASGGRGGQAFGGTGTDPAAAAGPIGADVKPLIAGKDVVRVEMVLHTALERRAAEEMLDRTVEAWLRQNGARPGTPYSIVLSNTHPYVFSDPASSDVTGRGGGRGAPPPAPPGRGGRGTGGRVADPGVDPRGTDFAAGAGGVAAGDLDRLAPLPTGAEGSAARPQSAFTIVWYAVLGEVPAPEASGSQGGEP
jgi:type IV pilus assembly protein PilM